MTNKNVEGPIGPLVTDAVKIVCPFCNGTTFQVSFDCVHNHELPADDPNYKAADTKQTMVFLCHCGRTFGKTIYAYDVVSAQAVPAVTLTSINSAVANDLAGKYLFCLGGTSIGLGYLISSNTLASPTVLTLAVAPNADINGKTILITDFKAAT